MKAAVRTVYGPPEILSIEELDKPTPKPDEVLVRVHASTVNRTDCAILLAKPWVMRFFTGLLRPRPGLSVTGTDFAGEIEAVGSSVQSFKVGDRVMGFDGFGLSSHAQYLTMPATRAMVPMPLRLTFEQAAASIEGAFYAQDMVHMIRPRAGQQALVYGATGAIGSAAVQLLKYYGLSVTAVCGGEHMELVRSLGADRTIDYRMEDFTKDRGQYEFVIDAVGKTSFTACRPLLKRKGIYASSEPNPLLVLITPLFGGKKFLFRPPKNVKEGLAFINELIQQGKFRPVIDRTYPLDRIGDAFRYVISGQKIGNVVIRMGDELDASPGAPVISPP